MVERCRSTAASVTIAGPMGRPAPRPAAGLRPAQRERLLKLLRLHGRNPNSFLAMYEGPWSLFDSDLGGVPYVEVDHTALAWGDPLSTPADGPALLGQFADAMRGRGLRVCMVPVQETVARQAMGQGHAVLKIGEEPVFDLTNWRPPRGDPGKRLRWALNHARRSGVAVEEYQHANRDLAVEEEIACVRAAWERSLGRRAVESFMRTEPLALAEHKRIFLARRDGDVVAVLACVPVYERDGWYLEDLVRLPDAVTGATELLIVEVLERLAAGGSRFATLGIAPLRGADRQVDRRARWLAGILRLAFERFDARYHFASLSRFKAKFRPTGWEARYATFLPPRPTVGLVRAVISVLDPQPARPRRVRARGASRLGWGVWRSWRGS
jgi:phosphatidylglycerol lysyltransferase